jgi:hypothetical protein
MEIYLRDFSQNKGMSEKSLNSLELRNDLPKDYLELLQKYNGGEGFIAEEYLVLHKAEEIKRLNKEYGIENFDTKIFLIGNNGNGEAIGIDLRNEKTEYILIPYSFEYKSIIKLAENINGLFKRIYEKGYF